MLPNSGHHVKIMIYSWSITSASRHVGQHLTRAWGSLRASGIRTSPRDRGVPGLRGICPDGQKFSLDGLATSSRSELLGSRSH